LSLKLLTLLSLLFLMPEASAQPIALGGEITSSPVVVDIDQNPDNGLEIVVGTESGYLYVLYQNGTSLPGWPRYVRRSSSSSYKPYFEYSSPAVADINNDGFLEVVITTVESQIIGSGKAAYISAYDLAGGLLWYSGVAPCIYSSPAVADVTGDGKAEVLIGSRNGILYNFYGNGSLYWSKSFGSGYVSTPATGDMDGDGILDIVIASSANGKIRVIKGDGNELMAFQTDGLGTSSPALGDVDNDGDPEIVAVSINGKLYAWNRDGTLLDGFPVQAGGTFISSPALADLDEDGMLDIVLTSEAGYVHVYRWNGELLPGFPLVEQGAITSSPALADLDGDGKLEIISGTYIHTFNEITGETTNTGKVYAWDINGTLLDGFPEDTGGFVRSSPAVADLDGNGKNEIVIGSNDGNLYIWETGATSDNLGWPMFHHDERNTRMYDAPTARISSPESGSFHKEGAPISFSAAAHDVDGSIEFYEWSSSIDGILSHSSSFTSGLSLGNHTISLMVKDDENKAAKTRIEITVTPAGEGGAHRESPIGEGVTTLTSALSRDIIKDLGLRTEQFYDVPIPLVATMAVLDEYPAPKDMAVRGILTKPVKTLSGDVYELSATTVLESYTTVNTLIIARGDLAVDSLASIAYANSEKMPILLTKPGELPSVSLNAISKLKPDKIIILGGPAAVSEAVETGLKKTADVQRIWGETRYETAIELANMIDQPDIIVITDGEDPNTDAVIISASYQAPLIYVRGEEIPQSVKDYLSKHKTAKVVLVGVSEGVIDEINEVVGG